MPSEAYHSIKKRFILSVGIMLGLLALLFIGHTLHEYRLVVESAEKRSASYASALKEHGERAFSEADNCIKNLIDDISEQGGMPFTQSERFYRLLSTAARSGPQFSSVYVVDRTGTIIAHSQAFRLKPIDVADRDYFLYHRDTPATGLYISRPFTSRLSGTTRFNLSRSIRGRDGAFIGVVAVTFETSYFELFYKSIDLGSNGRVLLSTTGGDLLVNEPRYDKPFASDFKSSVLFREYLSAAPLGTHIVKSPLTDSMRIMSYNSMGRFPVVAIVSLDRDQVLEPWMSSTFLHGGIVVFLMVAVVMLAVSSLRHFRRLEETNSTLKSQQEELLIANTSIGKVLDPIYWTWENARIWKVNEAAFRSLGYTEAEMLEMSVPDIAPPMTDTIWAEHWSELQAEGSSRLETQLRSRDGRIIDVEVVANLIDLGGRHANCAIVRDITERKQADRMQSRIVREWQNTFDAVEDAVWLLDMERRVVRANHATQRIFGLSAKDAINSRCCDILHDDMKPHEICPFDRMKATGRRATTQLRMSGRWYEVTIDPVFDDAGEVINAVHVVKDITDLKNSEQREQTRSRILERIAGGEELSGLLEFIARAIEQELPGALCSILLASPDSKRLLNGAAPSLPDFYIKATNRTKIGEGIGSCGTAAFRKERVVVEDIADHPFWKGFTPAAEAGLRSCWSEPILSSGGELLGTFAIYHRAPAAPGENEIRLIEQASTFAGIAIERSRNEIERIELIEQLHQSQKMETIGQLAGGIAHDFNNLLTPVIVYAEMLKRSTPPGDEKTFAKLDGIVKASHKARDLTQQLLGFGRKQPMNMAAADLNSIVSSFHSIIRRTLRENIDITLRLSPQLQSIKADCAKIEQVLLNLAINAQDAIEGNGAITIETGQVLVDDEYARQHPGIESGRYAMLQFSDTGRGMEEATLKHIYEPFFTTKQVGHGTGLGLANVYGIVKQHSGYIEARSKVGKGTVFNLYFPLTAEVPDSKDRQDSAAGEHHSGCGTVLLVEDNEMVRIMACELLMDMGYTVHAAEHPEHALEQARKLSGRLDLVLTDVVMPGMNGLELYEALRAEHPEIGGVLYMSGYTDNLTTVDLEAGDNFIQKPFTIDGFTEKIRKLLGSL